MEARNRWLRSFPTWSQLPNIGRERGPGGRLDCFEFDLVLKMMKGMRGRDNGIIVDGKGIDR